ncbi:hypothetical protein SARC_12827 [Sphaeroforma arctica JP610]|uniref:Uncharacterized protein n=1 Tax=Sphaeroforma arctica JP610 TaxID=667725 RepID=A0A0L0FCZ4_9EUKA|nr:hypothetical protein SARC_12827 [Sphaeroforma arctica JP610]KNC74634.1 hypothetical protein SARC_12827 [Sphaeroforma arctica JP610]|eukprot:XP_014148536.1 hypothetical protein SARC_12827 [Sphaeroforma arctica JP610]
MKKVLGVNTGVPNLQNVLIQGENGMLSSKEDKETSKSFPDLFANWSPHLAASLLHNPEFMTYECIADNLKYQAMVCEYSKIMYPEKVANLDKTHRVAVGQYLPTLGSPISMQQN